jgi:hypothetical protein
MHSRVYYVKEKVINISKSLHFFLKLRTLWRVYGAQSWKWWDLLGKPFRGAGIP